MVPGRSLTEAAALLAESLGHVEALGGDFFDEGDGRALYLSLELVALLEDGPNVYRAVFDHFVGDGPGGVELVSSFAAPQLAALCLRAGAVVERERCRARMAARESAGLRLSIPGQRAYYRGVQSWLDGNEAEARVEWVKAFDATPFELLSPNVPGEAPLVPRAHRAGLNRDRLAGYDLAHVWEARHDAALAGRVRDAWQDRGVRADILRLMKREVLDEENR